MGQWIEVSQKILQVAAREQQQQQKQQPPKVILTERDKENEQINNTPLEDIPKESKQLVKDKGIDDVQGSSPPTCESQLEENGAIFSLFYESDQTKSQRKFIPRFLRKWQKNEKRKQHKQRDNLHLCFTKDITNL